MGEPKTPTQTQYHNQIVKHLRKGLEASLELSVIPLSGENEYLFRYMKVTRTIENLLEYLSFIREDLKRV